MSKPRNMWWGYIKAVLKAYPSRTNDEETQAVLDAISETERMEDGADRLKVVNAVFFRKTHSLTGASLIVPCSESTAKRYHNQFIRCVARNFKCEGLK